MAARGARSFMSFRSTCADVSWWWYAERVAAGRRRCWLCSGACCYPPRVKFGCGGQPMSRLRDHQRAALRRDQVGYVFQDFGLLERMSVIENVLLPLVPTGGPTQEAAARAGQLLERCGLTSRRQEQVSRLSGGERQRVALARAFIIATAGPSARRAYRSSRRNSRRGSDGRLGEPGSRRYRGAGGDP